VSPYALETDWLAEAAGFEHLHSRIGIAKTLSSRRQDSNLCILKSDLLNFGDLQPAHLQFEIRKFGS
jgi:hypothetical protein